MKTMYQWLLVIVMTFAIHETTQAQCVNGLQSISYDTVVMGNGNSYYNFNFPKFNPALGTLLQVAVTSEVTLSYGFQVENNEDRNISFRVRVYRDDEISGSHLQTPIYNNSYKQFGPYALAPHDGVVGSGSDFLSMPEQYVMDHSIISDTVYNTADYLGAGSVSMDYYADSYAALLGGATVQFTGAAVDTVAFRVTYMYCNTSSLPADIISFNARKKDNTVDVQWTSLNEKTNRVYELQKSSDGKNFTGVAKFAASPNSNAAGSYRHQYAIRSTDKGKIIFRLKQMEQGGEVKYSSLRIIDNPSDSKSIRLYPNPAYGATTLLFDNVERSDWKVDIYTMSMQLVKSMNLNNVLQVRINADNSLTKGIYIIKAVNKNNGTQFAERLIIR